MPIKPRNDDDSTEVPAKKDEAVALVAVRCMCELLTSVTHFNFRINLMTAIVSRMSTLKWTEVNIDSASILLVWTFSIQLERFVFCFLNNCNN